MNSIQNHEYEFRSLIRFQNIVIENLAMTHSHVLQQTKASKNCSTFGDKNQCSIDPVSHRKHSSLKMSWVQCSLQLLSAHKQELYCVASSLYCNLELELDFALAATWYFHLDFVANFAFSEKNKCPNGCHSNWRTSGSLQWTLNFVTDLWWTFRTVNRNLRSKFR